MLEILGDTVVFAMDAILGGLEFLYGLVAPIWEAVFSWLG